MANTAQCRARGRKRRGKLWQVGLFMEPQGTYRFGELICGVCLDSAATLMRATTRKRTGASNG